MTMTTDSEITSTRAQAFRAMGYLTIVEVVERLQRDGVYLGRGDPFWRLRRLQSAGLIAPPVRVGFNARQRSVALYQPEILAQVRELMTSGLSSHALAQERTYQEFKTDIATTSYQALPPEKRLEIDAKILLGRAGFADSGTWLGTLLDALEEGDSPYAQFLPAHTKKKDRQIRQRILKAIRHTPVLQAQVRQDILDRPKRLARLANDPFTPEEIADAMAAVPFEEQFRLWATKVSWSGWSSFPVMFADWVMQQYMGRVHEALRRGDINTAHFLSTQGEGFRTLAHDELQRAFSTPSEAPAAEPATTEPTTESITKE